MFEPVFVSLKPKWEPFRLSNKLLETASAALDRPSSSKCDVETYHLEARTASRKDWWEER